MPRFFVDPRDWQPPHFTLRGDEAHHAHTVLRQQVGQELRLFQGEGAEWRAQITRSEAHEVQLLGIEPIQEKELATEVHLFQALPKGSKMELIIQKAVELGVSEIQPIQAQRSVMRLDPGQAARKIEKWQRIATEAAKQCGHPRRPQVNPPQTLAAALAAWPNDEQHLLLLTSLQPDTQPLLRALDHIQQTHDGHAPPKIGVLIGPEGDFSHEEIAHARAAGAIPVSLGPLVLRTETAALAALAQITAAMLVERLEARG